jgi:hypothetical protein
VLDDFGKVATARKGAETKRLFQLFSLLLKQYVNTYGAGLLAAQGITQTVLPGKRRVHTSQPIEKLSAREVSAMLRGFGLFFLLFKVDAPDEVKDAWWALTRRLSDYMIKRGYVRSDFQLSFEPCSDEEKINAVCVAGLINLAAEEQMNFEPGTQKERSGEPFYLVSRVVPGKLWFLHSPAAGKIGEFGPVAVPPAVANFIKTGWGLDCKFVGIGGRWHITKVEDVLPL